MQARARTFQLKEISAFDLTEQMWHVAEGQGAWHSDKPDPNVTVYPQFTSQQPIYGKVSFGDPLDKPDPRSTYYFALDESGGTGQGYDRLYFDLNQDGDLTNDKVLSAQKNPPKGAIPYSDCTQQVCFDTVAIPLPFGAAGERPLEVMPRLLVSAQGYKTISFVTTTARQGRIRIAGKQYDVLLGHNYTIAGWFDNPWTTLYVTEAGSPPRSLWMAGDELAAVHKIDGTFYQFAATPAGDELTVRPYEGPLGVFEVDAGGRAADVVEVQGSLRSRNATIAVGEISRGHPDSPTLAPVKTCKLPIGDYLPENLTVRLGKLRINFSSNYHTDGKRMDTRGRQWVYGIHVCEDKPFVLDFSNPPAVLFAGPVARQRVKPGEELKIFAVLTDPVLDIMIRRLQDTTQKRRETTSEPDGGLSTSYVDVSLDPKVTIERANGEIVAEGVMPFDGGGLCRYSWRVPNDLKIDGEQETFTIEVTYDTRELYGTVKGKREIIVHR
jgi:hypothetical protein